MKRVAVVGAGIAGLSVAYELSKRGVGPVTVLEERPRTGGTIHTVRESGFLVEGGPDSFITQKPWAMELCRELGLEDRLIPAGSRRVYVYSRKRLRLLPEGVFLTVPTRIWPFLASSLISIPGKLRMALDLVLPRGAAMEDESLGSFVRRRLGAEALEKIAEPIMGGIYLADAEQLSLRSTFPRFLELEREHRSLIRALRRTPATGATSPFRALRGGMTELVDRLVERMPSVTIRTGRSVEAVTAGPPWSLRVAGETVEADALILACPAPRAAELLRPLYPGLAEAVGRIRHVGSATISLGYERSAISRPLDATGFVIPRGEGRRIAACSWSSVKFEDRAPADRVLLRCFFKEPAADDAGLLATARAELRELMGIEAGPVLAKVFRWPGANPIYEVGHSARIREIDAKTPRGLHLTGSGYRGVGIPDCVKDARMVAEAVAGSLN